MFKIVKTNSKNADFIVLVKQLDAYLVIVDGDDHDFYNQYNGLEEINHVVVAYENAQPISCGAIKAYTSEIAEIKRMFTVPSSRGKGSASALLKALEEWTTELGYEKLMLETGKRQVEAIGLYQKSGYLKIENFGPYQDVSGSICFEKTL